MWFLRSGTTPPCVECPPRCDVGRKAGGVEVRNALLVESALFKSHDDGLQMALGAFGRAANDVRKRHGLNERDDFKALASPMSTDNQGDAPVPMGARMRAQQAGG